MQETLLQQGVDLMLYGMGTVLVFLTLLVIATMAMSRIMLRYFPDPVVEDKAPSRPGPQGAALDDKTRRIIEAAIRQHRGPK